jgi:molybdopterin synthase catalytic subunit
MAHASITRDEIVPADLIARVQAPANGAIALFLGVVREQNDDRAVSGMHYDAYEAMAVDVLREIATEAESKMGGGTLVAVHRIGELAIGEVSVAIAAASPHRAPVFDATRFVIEEIKRKLPVWKEERYIDGESEWLDGSIPPVPS